MVEKPQKRLRDGAEGAIRRVRSDGGQLVARVGDSYREWASDSAVIAVAPEPHLLPVSGPGDSALLAVLLEHDPLASDESSFAMNGLAIDPDAFVLAEIIVAASIAGQCADSERAERMERVVLDRIFGVRDQSGVKEPAGIETVLAGLTDDWTPSQRMLLLIETAGSNPFAPHQIAWQPKHELQALAHVASVIGLEASDAENVANTFAAAAKAHSQISKTKVGMYGLSAAAIVGTAGLLAAPVVGAAIGSAAGLSGAAATSYGLGLLGTLGGASAPGTLTAGGTWLIAQAGLTAGALAGAGGSFLFELGAAQAQNEIIKLQVTYKLILLDLQRNDQAALEVMSSIEQRVVELEAAYEDERELSDPDAPVLQDMSSTMTSLRNAEAWMEDQAEFPDDGSVFVSVNSLVPRIERLERLVRRTPRSDAEAKYETELSPAALDAVDRRIDHRFSMTAELDRWDVIAGISAGIVGGVIDAAVVGDPSSQLTKAFRAAASSPADNWLSKVAKVPFDAIGTGMTPNTHRVLTPGHDPLLGLVYGTVDILSATMTHADVNGALRFVDNTKFVETTSVFEALTTQVAHLLSDVISPAGLPLPGWAALTMNPDTAGAAVTMYAKGYDTWHLAPMMAPIAAIHGVTSSYWGLRGGSISEHRRDAVTLIATGIAVIGDLGAMLAFGGNPLAVNYPLWLDLARRIPKQARARARRSALVTMDDATRHQHRLNHGWSALLG